MSRKKKAVSQEVMTGEVAAISHEGRGIIKVDNKPYFLEGALPGEVVNFQAVRKRRKITEAKILSWETTSEQRVVPPCQHADLCGGCSLQHMSSSHQVEMKQQTLLEQLMHFGQVQPETVLPTLTAETVGYRRKARLGVKYVDKKGKLLMGFREKSSRYLADIEHCVVLHPTVQKLFEPLRSLIAGLSVYRNIPQVEVAVGDDATALVLRHLEPLSDEDTQQCHAFAQHHEIHLYLQPGNEDSAYRLYPEVREESPGLIYKLDDQQLSFGFRPTDFIQVNAKINQQMINRVLELLQLQPSDKVLDLFCGVGNLTLPLATKAGEVVGVEGDARLIARARDNAKRNSVKNTDFHVADLRQDHRASSWFTQDYDKLVIDPPRSGAADCIEQLSGKLFKRIVYVSCNPATLARDAGELVKQGYTLQAAGVLDMFPHTAHTESIALFTGDN